MTVSKVTFEERLGQTILGHLHQSFPYKPGHVLIDGEDASDPTLLSPVFRGSFDWHSSVHSHWALLRLVAKEALTPETVDKVSAMLDESFEPARVAAELAQLDRPHRRGFELPYGMAWLLTLGAELLSFHSWSASLAPLVRLARDRFYHWLDVVPCPIRSGQHSQSAFAMSLVVDAATTLGDDDLAGKIRESALAFYGDDQDAPIGWEPSAYDFLSPALAEADLMRRVLGGDFETWFDRFLPTIDLVPVGSADQSDGKLAHADGLNLSRAWMLRSLAAHRPALAEQADAHEAAALAAMETATYAGTHWLPSFAIYLRYGAA